MTYDEVVRINGRAGKVDATTETPNETGRKVKDEIVMWVTPNGIVGVDLLDGKVLLKYHNASHLRQDPVPL